MIWHAIFSFWFSIAQFIIGLLPDLTDVDLANIAKITDAFHNFRGYVLTANTFFPLDTAFTCLSIIIAFEVALAIWKLIRWVASILSIGVVK